MKFDILEQEKLVGAARMHGERAARFAPSAQYLPKSVQLDDALCAILLVALICWLM